MKILHVLLCRGPFPAFKYGGTERVVWSLASAQKKQGHDVKFLMRPHEVRPEGTLLYNKKNHSMSKLQIGLILCIFIALTMVS